MAGWRRRLLLGLVAFAGPVSALDEAVWSGGATGVYQYSDDSRAQDELSASADLFLRLDGARGEWLVYVEASTAPAADELSALHPTANADSGSVRQGANGGVQISEFNYSFRLPADSRLMLGLVDPTAWLDHSRITNDENLHFLNANFVNNPSIAFPDYTLGAVFRRAGAPGVPEFTLLLTGSHGLAAFEENAYRELFRPGAAGRGAFLAGGATWERTESEFRLGGWLRTDRQPRPDSPGGTARDYGVYALVGWHAGPHALNARLGLANAEVSAAARFLALAYQHETRFGLFGIGVARSFVPEAFRTDERAFGTDAEIFYRIPLAAEGMHVTPSVQYLHHPGAPATLVAGLRWVQRW